MAVRRRQLAAERAAVNAVIPVPDATAGLRAAAEAVAAVRDDRARLEELARGRVANLPDGHPYRSGPIFAREAQAAVAVDAARGVLGRRRARGERDEVGAAVGTAEQRLAVLVDLERVRLGRREAQAARERDRQVAVVDARQRWLDEHPVARRRLDRIQGDLGRLEDMESWQRQAEGHDREAARLAAERPAVSEVLAAKAVEDVAAWRLAELQTQLAARRGAGCEARPGSRKLEVDQLRGAHQSLWYPAEHRAERWDQRMADAQRSDAAGVAGQHRQADQARSRAQGAWQGLHHHTPAIQGRSIDRSPPVRPRPDWEHHQHQIDIAQQRRQQR